MIYILAKLFRYLIVLTPLGWMATAIFERGVGLFIVTIDSSSYETIALLIKQVMFQNLSISPLGYEPRNVIILWMCLILYFSFCLNLPNLLKLISILPLIHLVTGVFLILQLFLLVALVIIRRKYSKILLFLIIFSCIFLLLILIFASTDLNISASLRFLIAFFGIYAFVFLLKYLEIDFEQNDVFRLSVIQIISYLFFLLLAFSYRPLVTYTAYLVPVGFSEINSRLAPVIWLNLLIVMHTALSRKNSRLKFF